MSQQVSITYCGVDGFGRTLKEARKYAMDVLSRFVAHHTPKLVYIAGHFILVTRDPEAWSYRIIDPEDLEKKADDLTVVCNHLGYMSASEAERAGRRHLAQNLIFGTPDNGMSVLKNENDRREHVSYIGWQLACRDAASRGLSDAEQREFANREGRRFQPELKAAG